MSSRSYRSDTRAESARETRRRILAAAERELLEAGYHGTSIATLAAAAGVSPQTIYNAVGTKAQVLKAVYDALLAGDDDPIPMHDRPEFQAVLAQRSLPATMRAYARVGR
ncbi:MAG TPA: helix-turn-helix domain-containing protein, partial [Micromonosporaceae bacterium]